MNNLTLTVTVEEGNLIKASLMELPYKVSYALINKLDEQARMQMNPEIPEQIVFDNENHE